MLDATRRVRLYSKALELITTGRYDKKDTYVHDYDVACYRKEKDYTLNGLHWAYPDSIVATITREAPDGVLTFLCATWVTEKLKKHSQYGQNSRFKIVKFKEIRPVVELGIQQKLAKAQKDMKADTEFLAVWEVTKKKQFKKYLKSAIRIDKGEYRKLDIIIMKPERLVVRGMGSFLEKPKKGEVSISKGALDLLNEAKERSGLNFIEFFEGPIIAGMFRSPVNKGVPLDAVSVSRYFVPQLQKIATIES